MVTLFLAGDVMTGRGIDQVLLHPSDPTLHEDYVKDARMYVTFAEEKNGPIPRPVNYAYIWGDALDELSKRKPDLRIINLETCITTSATYWAGKPVHYRMNPLNVQCLSAAKVDCCALANNHSLDWGLEGLRETLYTLKKAHIKVAGAGENSSEALAPAIFELKGKGRVLVFSFGAISSGVPKDWAATESRAGVNWIGDYSHENINRISKAVNDVRREGDVVVFSIHWGSNWGYDISEEERVFAHRLIDEAEVDVIHGHSSHHFKGIESYGGKLILYGCGDFINDYEGIGGYESYRADLCLMYFPRIDISSNKVSLEMGPMRIEHFRLNKVGQADSSWIANTLDRESKKLGCRITARSSGSLSVEI